jgi:hypothetical protein
MKMIVKDLKDSIIGVNYDLVTTNAKELSNILKADIDVHDFISEKLYIDSTINRY